MRQIILDTETTGLSPADGHRIIEVGALEMINRRLTGRSFHYYVNPERPIEKAAQAVHGISQAFLRDKPLFITIMDELLHFISDSELIIHNAPFDIGFLHHEFTLTKKDFSPLHDICKVCDTLVMARQLHPGQKNNLDALCKRYKVDNTNRQLHGALLDAKILAEVYLAMTGGQSSLFDEMEEVAALHKVNNITTAMTEGKLAVQLASKEELEAHHQYLAFLKKESQDQCVWEEEEVL